MFWLNENTDICNYADDTTPYACDIDIQNLIRRPEHDCLLAIEWFESNYMKLNEDKCDFLIAGSKNKHFFSKVGDTLIWESNEVHLLDLTIDRNLKLNAH